MKMGINVVCDRYIYDAVVGLSIDFNYSEKKFFSMLNNFFLIVPEPNLIFLMDVNEEYSLSRKDDIPSITHITERRPIYEKIKEINEKIILLDGTLDILKIENIIVISIEKLIGINISRY